MLSDDPFCVRHGVPFDAFEGCWRCASDAAEREKAKREVSNEKDAEIARLRADLEQSQSDHRHTMHVMDRMQDEIVGLRSLVESAEANAKLHFEAAEEMRAENEKLRAARLRPETVNFIRHEMFIQWNRPEDADEEVDAVIADLNRCYPPEEV